MFPAGLLSNLPQLETRKALLVLDLQNDFVQADGKLPIGNVPEFLPYVKRLAAAFRHNKADVIWTQTEFQEPRESFSPINGDLILLSGNLGSDAQVEQRDLNNEGAPSDQTSTTDTGENAAPDCEAFLSGLDADPARQCCASDTHGFQFPSVIAKTIDHARDTIFIKSDYSALHLNSPLLLSLRMNLVTELYLCGSLSNISVYATACDAVRHGFRITIIEDCIGYCKRDRHVEAMRHMADIMGANGITSFELIDELAGNFLDGDEVEDEIEPEVPSYQAEAEKSSESLPLRPKLAEWASDAADVSSELEISVEQCQSPAASISDEVKAASTEVVLSSSTSVIRASTDNTTPLRKRSGRELDFAEPEPPLVLSMTGFRRRSTHDLEGAPSDRPRHKVNRIRIRPARGSVNEVQETSDLPYIEAFEQRPSAPPIAITADSDFAADADDTMSSIKRLSKKWKQNREKNILRPGDDIGEKDCRILYDFLPEPCASGVFQRLKDEIRWQKMYHRTGEVPRLVAVQGSVESDGSKPVYRHPADESPPLLPFSTTVNEIRTKAEAVLKHPVNHVLAQLYRGGEDNISEHSDKTLDIAHGSSIVNVSFGAQRTMTLRTKKSDKSPGPHSLYHTSAEARVIQRVPFPHNSLFVLGHETNRKWLHAIKADKRLTAEKLPEETAFSGERISLTFRYISTFISPHQCIIWGQGAKSKTRDQAGTVIEGDDREVEKIVKAFGQENHQGAEFRWEEHYGEGFDVVNFTTALR